MNLTEDEIIQLYGRWWDIEVFFKVSKSYLKLAKEWKALSYDALTAHVAFVFSRYMMLAVENRNEPDMKTIGELFYYTVDELKDITYTESLALIMQLLIVELRSVFLLDEANLTELISSFIANLPGHLRTKAA